ncbi:hypothetical protein BX600DRAFT_497372 [Xylariales sp. PMI_506]|nr:hypothetical protein BX600DRAFT_497372 [Xylariales sp. PMI_506]
MRASIVYEGGVASGTSRGSLFQDTKFWIAQRVPLRNSWVQHIEKNGGAVVKLEKQADFMIADHARKDAPAGSYSWKWIEDSIRNGMMLDAKPYEIQRIPLESRPAGAVQHKSGRTPFTEDDDRLLRTFVAERRARGEATSGNKIYQELENMYPHHTYQSWRNRWVKRLEPAMINDDLEDVHASPLPVGSRTQQKPAPSTPGASSHTEVPSTSASASVRRGKSSRLKFTPEEDTWLLEYVRSCEQEGKPTSGNKIYEEFAQDFPQHTWHSWRDRWLKQLKPLQRHHDSHQSTPVPALTEKRGGKQLKAATHVTSRPISNQETRETPRASETNSEQESAAPSPQTIPDGELARRESVNSGVHLDVQLSTTTSPHGRLGRGDRTTITPSPKTRAARAEYSSARKEVQSIRASSSPSYPSYSSIPFQINSQALNLNEKDFHRDLQDFLSLETQLGAKVNLWPKIQGRTLRLWDLWKAVMSQKVVPEERDWQLIAETLQFDWVQYETVPNELRRLYDDQLAAFEEALLEFDANDTGNDDDEEDSVHEDEYVSVSGGTPQVHLTESEKVIRDEHWNSSPPKQPSKRKLETASAPDYQYPETSAKRSRLSRDEEIPSTPDAINGTAHLRRPVSAGVSPSDNKFRSLPKSKNIAKYSSGIRPVSTREEVDDQVPELPTIARIGNAHVEPETQDFRFEFQENDGMLLDEDDDQRDSQNDITPSQQLHSESEAWSSSKKVSVRDRFNVPATPTPKRMAKSPFLMEDDDDSDAMVELTPKARYGKGPNPILEQPEMLRVKRRVLPAEFFKAPQEVAAQRAAMPPPAQPSTQTLPPPTQGKQSAKPSPDSPAIKLGEVVEYWVSLGYPQDIARRSLEATTWEPSLAGRIMEMLKHGESIPTNWEGVWSTRDDASLTMIDSAEPPKDEREARKRRSAAERLANKHGEERMELRRKWLTTKARL